jgi:hypothetical protein
MKNFGVVLEEDAIFSASHFNITCDLRYQLLRGCVAKYEGDARQDGNEE